MKKRKKRITPNYGDTQEGKLAVVIGTKEELELVGIDVDLEGQEVMVYDINRYGGMCAPNSRIISKSPLCQKIVGLEDLTDEYIIPTRWLSFVKTESDGE